jgi:purine-nucleoside phosphorylase
MYTLEQYQETAAAIRARTRWQPKTGIILGSGLSGLADSVTNADIIEYADIPHWPHSTVPGHSGRLVIGQLQGQTVLMLQGRSHTYEGYEPHKTTLPIRVMRLLGIETLIVTNAAGGINPDFQVGDLMLITDHIGWAAMAGVNPLRGHNLDEFGPRFPDLTFAYDRELQKIAHETAASLGFSLREGTYTWITGPNFETPAEIRMLYRLGTDAVGMSTVPEVIVAVHSNMRVLAFSTITNVAPHHPAPDHVTDHEEVLETGRIVVPRLTALLEGVLQRL